VAYYVVTALGREVPLGDWEALQGDAVLKILHDYRASPFNEGNAPLAVAVLVNATGLVPAQVAALCENLQRRHLIQLLPGGFVQITAEGVNIVRSSTSSAG
jgi:hypothetical protein